MVLRAGEPCRRLGSSIWVSHDKENGFEGLTSLQVKNELSNQKGPLYKSLTINYVYVI